jgi:glycosyltransferase involved in cell wall biosynthesis
MAPRVSVFTPSHDTRYLDEAFTSLVRQSFADWEWIVVLNGRAGAWKPPEPDPRIHVTRAGTRVKGVGALKALACSLASGDYLVELDHDDLLGRACLAQVVDAFRDPAIVVVYSDWAQINADGSANHDRFDLSAGWEYSQGSLDGRQYDRCHAMAATPHNLGYIWYAPNHVRAFRRTAYEATGGYDPELHFLDDQDLMARLYRVGEFHHVPRCLYLQRTHSRSTQSELRTNAAIQEQTVVQYRRSIEELALAWAGRQGLRALRLRTPVWIGDELDPRYEELVVDPAQPQLAAADESVGLIIAYDVLQRLPRRIELFNELYRVLAHAGLVLTQTPSTDGRGAFQDPGNVAFYNENSFMYLTQEALHEAVPDLTARFQVSHLRTFYPTPGHEELLIPYVQANLLAVKDGPRQGGPLLC